MSQFYNSNVMAMSSLYSYMSIPDSDNTILYNPKFYWNYQQRTKELAAAPSLWQELWYPSGLNSGDPTNPFVPLGNDWRDFSGWFEGPLTIMGGNWRPYLFRGYCYNASSVALGGAVITAYVTSTNAVAGTVTSNDQGYYECPSIYPSVNHYLVATDASGTLAGVTVNTLQPTAT